MAVDASTRVCVWAIHLCGLWSGDWFRCSRFLPLKGIFTSQAFKRLLLSCWAKRVGRGYVEKNV
jgi:hypothetical protein